MEWGRAAEMRPAARRRTADLMLYSTVVSSIKGQLVLGSLAAIGPRVKRARGIEAVRLLQGIVGGHHGGNDAVRESVSCWLEAELVV